MPKYKLVVMDTETNEQVDMMEVDGYVVMARRDDEEEATYGAMSGNVSLVDEQRMFNLYLEEDEQLRNMFSAQFLRVQSSILPNMLQKLMEGVADSMDNGGVCDCDDCTAKREAAATKPGELQ